MCRKVRFALSSSSTWSRSDMAMDNEGFFNSVLTLLSDPEEADEVNSLLSWWNQSVFLSFVCSFVLIGRNH